VFQYLDSPAIYFPSALYRYGCGVRNTEEMGQYSKTAAGRGSHTHTSPQLRIPQRALRASRTHTADVLHLCAHTDCCAGSSQQRPAKPAWLCSGAQRNQRGCGLRGGANPPLPPTTRPHRETESSTQWTHNVPARSTCELVSLPSSMRNPSSADCAVG
jgi:hypothetical protein